MWSFCSRVVSLSACCALLFNALICYAQFSKFYALNSLIPVSTADLASAQLRGAREAAVGVSAALAAGTAREGQFEFEFGFEFGFKFFVISTFSVFFCPLVVLSFTSSFFATFRVFVWADFCGYPQ
jgi:hypothetical protein